LIAILDYGSGNLRSALRAFETTGRQVTLTADAEIAANADALVVPGVGAFGACMTGLKSVNGDQIIKSRVAAGKPTLGICVGMQIMFQQGVEHATFQGVGALQGTVEKLNAPVLPHMGWNTVELHGTSKLFKGIERESFYFVHSYGVKNYQGENFATTNYHEEFIAALEEGTLSATQFHPEKSGAAGLKLISNWVESL
jgi:glutamine amidotransferase